MNVTIRIDMDRKCAECGKGGAADSGICLKCATKAMGDKPLKSGTAKAVRARFRSSARRFTDRVGTVQP